MTETHPWRCNGLTERKFPMLFDAKRAVVTGEAAARRPSQNASSACPVNAMTSEVAMAQWVRAALLRAGNLGAHGLHESCNEVGDGDRAARTRR